MLANKIFEVERLIFEATQRGKIERHAMMYDFTS